MFQFASQNPFSYELEEGRIAQRPVVPYHAAKLLVVDRKTARLREKTFESFPELVSERDLVVFNNTKVIPARLFGEIQRSGVKVEVFLLEEREDNRWLCLGRPLKRFKGGDVVEFGETLTATLLEKTEAGEALMEFSTSSGSVLEKIHNIGLMPVPPYIRKGISDEQDRTDYQTSFAQVDGSIAAPTASLHFTPELMSKLQETKCEVTFLTLHVGASSIKQVIQPASDGNGTVVIPPSAEKYLFDSALMEKCQRTKQRGGRVFAVGTTVVRALESMAREAAKDHQIRTHTDLFITPGFEFKVVDCLVTNFHQPGTTHMLLVEAFLGSRGLIEDSYRYALSNGFRFLSYGDGMCVLP